MRSKIRIFRWCVVSATLVVASCASDSMVTIESTNQSSRIDYVVIHATSENFAESLRLLTTPTSNPVSSHYLIPTLGDESYPHDVLRLYALVDEQRRAWHAGVSYWAKEESLNDRSIGIEIVNEFKCTGTDRPLEEIVLAEVNCDYLPYPDEQITMLIELLKDIQDRYPAIDPIDFVGHSDIAIMRKSDPGPLFPWQRLYEEGIGVWPDPELTASYLAALAGRVPDALTVQSSLLALGYRVDPSGEWDAQTRFALRAFQLHFRPADYSGDVDVETVSRLWALLEEYRPREFAALVAMFELEFFFQAH